MRKTNLVLNQYIKKLKYAKHIILTCQKYYTGQPILGRYHLPFLLNILGLQGKGVEIGVCQGEYSDHILSYSKLSLLYSIDPWKHFNSNFYYDNANVSQIEQEKRYEFCVQHLKKHKNRSKILRMTSAESSLLFKAGEFDFIYIDANHTFQESYKDMELWWPKLKRKGIFAGHDYTHLNSRYGVKKAVDQFATLYGQKPYITDEKYSTWYIIKK